MQKSFVASTRSGPSNASFNARLGSYTYQPTVPHVGSYNEQAGGNDRAGERGHSA